MSVDEEIIRELDKKYFSPISIKNERKLWNKALSISREAMSMGFDNVVDYVYYLEDNNIRTLLNELNLTNAWLLHEAFWKWVKIGKEFYEDHYIPGIKVKDIGEPYVRKKKSKRKQKIENIRREDNIIEIIYDSIRKYNNRIRQKTLYGILYNEGFERSEIQTTLDDMKSSKLLKMEWGNDRKPYWSILKEIKKYDRDGEEIKQRKKKKYSRWKEKSFN